MLDAKGRNTFIPFSFRSTVPMLEAILIILLVLATIIVVLLVVVAMQPAEFRVSRSASMAAPPADVFAQVNDFHRWQAWSPWANIDPAMKQTYEGSPSGTGAVYGWSGNSQVGEGRMTLTDSRPHERIQIQLDFLRPFKATNTAEFNFKPNGNRTEVTWSMSGRKNFIVKAFGLFMSMDKMVGGQFAKGLAAMKTVVESANAASPER
jgi:hypothetical protein